MKQPIHTFFLTLDFKLLNDLSAIDRFGGEWTAIEKREGPQTLRELKTIATVQSTGASTRIEGSKLSNDEVKVLIENLTISKLEERDQQEVIGYFNVLDIITESFQDISINESSIMNLHNQLMKFSDKDKWHKGGYKKNSNSVEATNPDGSKTIIFNTTPPGIETEDAMRELIEWYNSDNQTPSLLKAAAFVYEFLSIHPFQDGNGRLSRLIGTLLLLKNGYNWVQYVSFEHEIEQRKPEYYRVLMECQQKRPGEEVKAWVLFFTSCLSNIQAKLVNKLEGQKRENKLSPKEKTVLTFIENNPGCQSSQIALKLGIALPTVKRMLAELTVAKFVEQHGVGKGTNYTIVQGIKIQKNVIMKFTIEQPKQERVLSHRSHFIDINKIMLRPLFQWNDPNEWSAKLFNEGLKLRVECISQNGIMRQNVYGLSTFVSPFSHDPIFNLIEPISIPDSLAGGLPSDNEFPMKVVFEIQSDSVNSQFNVDLVIDAGLE
ncbi:MAG: Fic family protein [Flavobacteriia bacterium]|nr:Fic family protein [Flavobacteriia bacterium]